MPKNPLETMLDDVAWSKVEYQDGPPEGDLPHVTHKGVLDLAGTKLKVMQLSNGQRIVDADDFERFFGMAKGT